MHQYKTASARDAAARGAPQRLSFPKRAGTACAGRPAPRHGNRAATEARPIVMRRENRFARLEFGTASRNIRAGGIPVRRTPVVTFMAPKAQGVCGRPAIAIGRMMTVLLRANARETDEQG